MTKPDTSGGAIRRVSARGGAALISLGLGTWRISADDGVEDERILRAAGPAQAVELAIAAAERAPADSAASSGTAAGTAL